MLETEKQQLVQDFARNIQAQGLSMDQYFKFTGMTADKLMEQVGPNAEKRIKSTLVLENVAKAEKLEASEEDLENEYKRMADMYKMEVDKIKELLGENGLKDVKKDLVLKKAIDFVVGHAKEA